MIEYPEALTLAAQLNETVQGKRIGSVVAAHSPHKFAWFHGDPASYASLLVGKRAGHSSAYGGLVEIEVEDARMLFGDGVSLHFHDRQQSRPEKHQLLVEFEDGSAFSGSVQMYGGLWAFRVGEFENPYYERARKAPPPLSESFDVAYFDRLVSAPEVQKLSAKALLATEQRIPGLGNGVLQDILHAAGIHPRKKVSAMSEIERQALFGSVKSVLAQMVEQGGRDTEKDLFGQAGGYRTKLSRNTYGGPCPRCGGSIQKEAHLGGAVYFCAECQQR